MVASKGGISRDNALDMTRAEQQMWLLALGPPNGINVDWGFFLRTGEPRFLDPVAEAPPGRTLVTATH